MDFDSLREGKGVSATGLVLKHCNYQNINSFITWRRVRVTGEV